ncbi:hypothetical protein BJ741DRAFT_593026 [Chytriomyces cf. hyalinus JEL632]|nr:hypothetical protein BJ741DRAFT_593026 [Chytriomyces cf. hyalinus JEL632]
MSTTPTQDPPKCPPPKIQRRSAKLSHLNRRPPSAFQLYRMDKAQLLSKQPSGGLLSVQDMNKTVGAMWRDEAQGIRAEYLAKSAKLYASFTAKHPIASPPTISTTERKRMPIQQPALGSLTLKPILCAPVPFGLLPSPLLTLPPTPTGMTPESPVYFKAESLPSFSLIHAASSAYSSSGYNEQLIAAEALLSMACQKPVPTTIHRAFHSNYHGMHSQAAISNCIRLPELIPYPVVGKAVPNHPLHPMPLPVPILPKPAVSEKRQFHDFETYTRSSEGGGNGGAYGWLGRVQHERILL